MNQGLARMWIAIGVSAAVIGSVEPVFGHDGPAHSGPHRALAAITDGEEAAARAERIKARRLGGSRWGADYFPNVELTTHEGRRLRFFDDMIKDKVVLISFLYTHCEDACPLGTARLAKIQRILGERVGRDVYIYSITIDPARDTPAVLRRYAAKHDAGPGWWFLTGAEADILLLRKKLGLYIAGLREDLKDHNMAMLIGNQRTGRWMTRSPMDNPYFIAEQIGTWLTNWRRPSAHMADNYAKAPALRLPGMGEYLFRTRCAACHSIGATRPGGGTQVAATANPQDISAGPDLFGVTRRRDRDWLVRWISDPAQMLADGDPIARQLFEAYDRVIMPNFHFNDTELGVLLEYLEEETLRLEDSAAVAGGVR